MSTEEGLQAAFYAEYWNKYELIGSNICFGRDSSEMDLLCLRRNGHIDEVEIKLSAGNYLDDFNKFVSIKGAKSGAQQYIYSAKLKHEALKEGLLDCNRFSFLISESLLDKCEIPDYAGIYVYRLDDAGRPRISQEKEPKLLHKRKLSEGRKYDAAKKMAGRFWEQH